MKICVFCAASDNVDPMHKATAYTLGGEIGFAGHELVFGGGHVGLMGELARGVHDAGGHVTGVLPEKFDLPGIASRFCDEVIVEKDLSARRTRMRELADAFIALPGGFGTLEELMEAIVLKQLGYHNKAIVVLDNSGYFDPLFMQFAAAVVDGFAPLDDLKLYKVTSSVGETLEYLEHYIPPKIPDKLDRILAEQEGGLN